jgi:hypothetical protein
MSTPSSVHVSDLKQKMALMNEKLDHLEMQFEIQSKELKICIDKELQELQKWFQEFLNDQETESSEAADD